MTVAAPVRRLPNPGEPVPTVVGPTVALLAVGLAGWTTSTALYLTGVVPWWVTVAVNAVCSYLLFTVAHDAAHHSASKNARLDTLMGRLSVSFFAPHASYPTWQFIHIQHHRFTNVEDGRDPDRFVMGGPAWQRVFRLLVVDLWYMVYYVPKLKHRPRREQIEEVFVLAVWVGGTVAAVATGHGLDILVVLYLPCRVAILYLAWAFDYLPHHGLRDTPTQDKLKTTRVRVGHERLLSPVMLYQNYHLVHHLHPRMPFYRYVAAWRKNEQAYLDGDPALSTVLGRSLTSEEYRELRHLDRPLASVES